MLKFTLDNEVTEIPKENFSSFEEFYKIISEELEDSKRVIFQIKINEEVMQNGKQFEFFEKDFTNIDFIEIITKEKDTVIKENIEGFKEQCNLILSNISKSVEAFRTGKEVESQNHFVNIIEGIRWFNYALELLVSFLRIDAKIFKIKDKTINESVENLSSIINSISESQESEDWIMLADQLEYELKPEIEFWKNNIDKINE